MSSPKGHSLAVRYIRPPVRSTYCKKDERAKRGEIAPNNGRNFRKACNFPILSLSSFHILDFFSFVFGAGGFLFFILVYLLLFGLFGFGRKTHANGDPMRPKKKKRNQVLGFGWSIPVLVLLTLMDICVLFWVAFLSPGLLSISYVCSIVYGSKHSVCLYVLCLSFTIYDYDYDYEYVMIMLVYFTFHVSYFQFLR